MATAPNFTPSRSTEAGQAAFLVQLIEDPARLIPDMSDALYEIMGELARSGAGQDALVKLLAVRNADDLDPTDAERREARAAASADAFKPWERAA